MCIDWVKHGKFKDEGVLVLSLKPVYRNFPKFSDRQVLANSVDPDQTAPRGAV